MSPPGLPEAGTLRADKSDGPEDGVERYDMVVIGGGAAGINAAKTAASLKARVVLVDYGPLGGTCVNRG